MKITKILPQTLFFCFLITCTTAFSQEALVTVQNNNINGHNMVNIKWYSQQFVYSEGVNLYRMETGKQEWIKINETPIKQWAEMPKNELEKDSSLLMFTEIMKQIRPNQINGMVLLHLMAESFASSIFCKFIGIQYDDQNIEIGKNYQYKVMRLSNGKEELLATSDEILVGPFSPKEPPKDFFIKQVRKTLCIGWKPEDNRFYAVNVYRKSKAGKEKMLNHKPVTISMFQDSAGIFKYPVYKFIDDSITAGNTYEYRIAGIDFFGNETKYTLPIKISIKDVTLPSPPIHITKKVKNLNITISWENTEFKKLAGFNVYRSIKDSNDYVAINPVLLPGGANTFTDAVTKSGGYYYMVTSVDTSGNENFSEKIFAEVADIFPPAPPHGLSAIADTGCIKLSWQPNNESDLLGYQVYRSIINNSKSNYVLLNSKATHQSYFTDSLPKNARNQFFYRIAAIDTSFNRSDLSSPVSAKMPDVMPPEKPFIKNVFQLNAYLVIEWLPNTESDLAGYEVFRSTKGTKINFHKINEGLIDREVTRFTDRFPFPDSLYNYYLTAVDSAGNHSMASDYFTASTNVRESDTEKSTLKSFSVKANRKKGNKMQWNISTSNDFIGITIYRKTEDNETPMKITDLFTGKEFIDKNKGLHKPVYQLRLYHKSGLVIKSEWVSI